MQRGSYAEGEGERLGEGEKACEANFIGFDGIQYLCLSVKLVSHRRLKLGNHAFASRIKYSSKKRAWRLERQSTKPGDDHPRSYGQQSFWHLLMSSSRNDNKLYHVS